MHWVNRENKLSVFELLISYSKAFQGGNKVPACLTTLQPLGASLQDPSGSPNKLPLALLGPAPPTASSSIELGRGQSPCHLSSGLSSEGVPRSLYRGWFGLFRALLEQGWTVEGTGHRASVL